MAPGFIKSKTYQRMNPQAGSRRRLIIFLSFGIIVVIALAVGLGVGLTQREHKYGATVVSPVGWGRPRPSDGPPSYSQPTDIATATSTAPSTSPSTVTGPTTYSPSGAPTKLWQPAVNASWQIVLDNPLAIKDSDTSVTPDVDIFDIDMFANPASTISKLHQLGKKVLCYVSAGSYEPYRPDSSQFQDSDKGNVLNGWPDEYWLNSKSDNVRKIMAARIAMAAGKGCDAIDADNIDAYQNDNGMGLTQQDAIDYMYFLSSTTAKYNMALGLKNSAEIVKGCLDAVQFSVNEQCAEFKECGTFDPFIQAGKPVLHIEYQNDINKACNAPGTNEFSTVIKNTNLDGWVGFCNGTTAASKTA